MLIIVFWLFYNYYFIFQETNDTVACGKENAEPLSPTPQKKARKSLAPVWASPTASWNQPIDSSVSKFYLIFFSYMELINIKLSYI